MKNEFLNLERDFNSPGIVNNNLNSYEVAKKEQQKHKSNGMKLEIQRER